MTIDGKIFYKEKEAQLPRDIDLNGISPGYYLVIFQTGERFLTGKFCEGIVMLRFRSHSAVALRIKVIILRHSFPFSLSLCCK